MKRIIFTILSGLGIIGIALAAGGTATCDPTQTRTSSLSLTATSDLSSTTDELNNKSFSCGTYETDIIPIPDKATRIIVGMSRDTWTEKGAGVNIIEVQTDYFDGKEWTINQNIGGFTTDGGDRFDEEGRISTESYNSSALPPGKGRMIRVRVLSKIDLASTVTIKFQ